MVKLVLDQTSIQFPAPATSRADAGQPQKAAKVTYQNA